MTDILGKKLKIEKSDILESEKELEYILFARAYLILAYRGSEEVLRKLREGKFSNPFGEMVPDWVYECNYLLAPILFNLKHAIEIFLKGLARLVKSDFKENHDLNLLFNQIEKKIKKGGGEKEVKKVEVLVRKYYENRFLEDKIGASFTMEDKFNDVFRYPDSKAKLKLHFSFIFPKFKEKDLQELQKDIRDLDGLFYEIGEKLLLLTYPKRPTLKQTKELFERMKKELG